jgi:hypothetical protein
MCGCGCVCVCVYIYIYIYIYIHVPCFNEISASQPVDLYDLIFYTSSPIVDTWLFWSVFSLIIFVYLWFHFCDLAYVSLLSSECFFSFFVDNDGILMKNMWCLCMWHGTMCGHVRVHVCVHMYWFMKIAWAWAWTCARSVCMHLHSKCMHALCMCKAPCVSARHAAESGGLCMYALPWGIFICVHTHIDKYMLQESRHVCCCE